MRKKREYVDTAGKSVYDLTTRELRAEIRKRTASVNVRINEYREAVEEGKMKANKIVESGIRRLQEASSAEVVTTKKVNGKRKTTRTGVYAIPKSKTGEVGLGLSYKSKSELQRQLASLRRFEEKDISTPEGEREWSKKVEQQYETFKQRYGDISKDEYNDMIDTMNIVKNTLKDYGYEDLGGSYARRYVRATEQGKRKFAKYIDKIKRDIDAETKEAKRLGKKVSFTTEDILDRLSDALRKNKEMV